MERQLIVVISNLFLCLTLFSCRQNSNYEQISSSNLLVKNSTSNEVNAGDSYSAEDRLILNNKLNLFDPIDSLETRDFFISLGFNELPIEEEFGSYGYTDGASTVMIMNDFVCELEINNADLDINGCSIGTNIGDLELIFRDMENTNNKYYKLYSEKRDCSIEFELKEVTISQIFFNGHCF